MTQQHFVVKWEGYPVMSLNSMSDAQEMILAIAQENAYYDFYQETQCGEGAEWYIDYIEYLRENENYKWYDANTTSLITWYGYALLKSVESYSIGAIIHLD